MEFYLTAPDGSRIHFPVNPEKVTCQTGNKIITFDVIALGEIALPRGYVPTKFIFEGFFPGEARKNSPFVKDWRPPKELVGLLSLWRSQGTKLRLLVTETPINHDVYFDGENSFQHEWRGGHGDCWYSIRLVQARDLVVLTDAERQAGAATSGSGQGQVPVRPVPPPPKTYVVKPGDTLWAIAKLTLGDGSRWKEIYEANKDVIGPDPNVIIPGQELRIA
ncbi:LysM peptidoglycan-binding domain-containing protein [Desulfovirgula thermocuniculi]|uniref:LysM peptidoglycan-binding domain-containing protein n=1 Tax=Desulfovirgula thermocuniculi TaxID=348842 RepID=UPI0004075381|nr:LysM peptidoglycan-binding domain-containing protein [Desulfovirgula thermocuniculi]